MDLNMPLPKKCQDCKHRYDEHCPTGKPVCKAENGFYKFEQEANNEHR